MIGDIDQLASKIYGSLEFDKHRIALYWDKKELHILDYPDEDPNLVLIEAFTPGATIKEIKQRLVFAITKMIDGPRIYTSLEKHSDQIRRSYLAETT